MGGMGLGQNLPGIRARIGPQMRGQRQHISDQHPPHQGRSNHRVGPGPNRCDSWATSTRTVPSAARHASG